MLTIGFETIKIILLRTIWLILPNNFTGVKMVKKKISGQTIAIIILTAVLLLTIGFGGVFAYYTARSNKISGGIVMGNLKIALTGESGESGKSEIVISNKTNILPSQSLGNSPLVVNNLSSVPIYLVLVYEFKAEKINSKGNVDKVTDNHTSPVFDLGMSYINSINPNHNNTDIGIRINDWVDYVFVANEDDEQAGNAYVEESKTYCKAYRCLVSLKSIPAETDVEIIAKDQLSLASAMGNEYQETTISFTFQAYAIGSELNDFKFPEGTTTQQKCQKIVEVMYASQAHKFLDI